MAFWAGVQVDAPITHRITVRFLDYIDNRYVIIRNTASLDGQTRQEIFREARGHAIVYAKEGWRSAP